MSRTQSPRRRTAPTDNIGSTHIYDERGNRLSLSTNSIDTDPIITTTDRTSPLEIGTSPSSESSGETSIGIIEPDIPILRDFLVEDENYVQFLLGDRSVNHRDDGPSPRRRQHQQQYSNQCGSFCTGFSFVGMLFLIWVGLIIEIQPIFIKGISPKKPLYIKKDNYRQMMSVNTEDSSISSIRQKINMAWYYTSNDNFNLNGDQVITTRDQMLKDGSRNLEDDNDEYIEVYEMKYEAKSSFKAAAAYFLTMVISFIYTQNSEGFSLNFLQRIKQAVYLRQNCAVVYNNYRRRKYNDIPDDTVSSMTGATVPNYEETIGTTTASIEEEERVRNFEASLDLFKKMKTSIPKSKRK